MESNLPKDKEKCQDLLKKKSELKKCGKRLSEVWCEHRQHPKIFVCYFAMDFLHITMELMCTIAMNLLSKNLLHDNNETLLPRLLPIRDERDIQVMDTMN